MRCHHRVLPVLVVGVVASLGGCEGGNDLPLGSVRDSSGVRIVEFDRPSVVDTIADAPVLSLGTEGDPDLEFFRLAGVVPLASGNLVAVNAGTAELRFFGPDGTHIRTVGGSGDGPEEFGFLSTVWPGAADRLHVFDPRRRRIVTFDSAGTYVGGIPFGTDLPAGPPAAAACFGPNVAGLLSNGARLVRGWQCFDFRGSDGIREMRLPLSIVGDDGTVDLGDFVATRYWERGDADSPVDRYAFLPLVAPLVVEATGARIVMSHGRDYALEVRDSIGAVVSMLRDLRPPPAVTADTRAAHAAALVETGRQPEQDVPYPDRFGGYDRLVVDRAGEVWARKVGLPGATNTHWSVFALDGSDLREVILPAQELSAVRDGRLYTIATDDLGIQRIRVLEDPR